MTSIAKQIGTAAQSMETFSADAQTLIQKVTDEQHRAVHELVASQELSIRTLSEKIDSQTEELKRSNELFQQFISRFTSTEP